MPAQYPGIGWPQDSQVDLLRKLVNNTALIAEGGGGGGAGLPSQTGHAGEYLTTNGTDASWAALPGGSALNSWGASTNNTGNTTITQAQANETYALTFTGSAGARIIILDVTGRTAGDKLFLDLILPATAAIVISVRNATAGGTLLLPVESFPTQDLTTDGSLLSAHWEFTFNGTAWVFDMSNLPA